MLKSCCWLLRGYMETLSSWIGTHCMLSLFLSICVFSDPSASTLRCKTHRIINPPLKQDAKVLWRLFLWFKEERGFSHYFTLTTLGVSFLNFLCGKKNSHWSTDSTRQDGGDPDTSLKTQGVTWNLVCQWCQMTNITWLNSGLTWKMSDIKRNSLLLVSTVTHTVGAHGWTSIWFLTVRIQTFW